MLLNFHDFCDALASDPQFRRKVANRLRAIQRKKASEQFDTFQLEKSETGPNLKLMVTLKALDDALQAEFSESLRNQSAFRNVGVVLLKSLRELRSEGATVYAKAKGIAQRLLNVVNRMELSADVALRVLTTLALDEVMEAQRFQISRGNLDILENVLSKCNLQLFRMLDSSKRMQAMQINRTLSNVLRSV